MPATEDKPKASAHQMVTYPSVEAWQEEAVKRFGVDPLLWRTRCPICGNVQTAEDFRKYKDQGATPDSAAVECIGRYTKDPYRAFGENPPGKPKRPCDYAAYGLFGVGVDVVLFPKADGSQGKRHVFPFAEPYGPDNQKSKRSRKQARNA